MRVGSLGSGPVGRVTGSGTPSLPSDFTVAATIVEGASSWLPAAAWRSGADVILCSVLPVLKVIAPSGKSKPWAESEHL